jgi:hypothetical protein
MTGGDVAGKSQGVQQRHRLIHASVPRGERSGGDDVARLRLDPILGTWTNVDPATRGIVKLVFSEDDGALSVQAFGACTPAPSDLGATSAQSYASSVNECEIVAFTATYRFGFKSTVLTGHLEGARLILGDHNVFHDESDRSAYFTQEAFTK